MIFKVTTLIVALLFLGLPLSVMIAAFAERKYLESKSGTQYVEAKAFLIWVMSLIIIFGFILFITNLIADGF